MSKAVVPRELARQDTDEAINYYLSENAPEAALGFIDALEHIVTSAVIPAPAPPGMPMN
jgi:toxin ParE1/3/4